MASLEDLLSVRNGETPAAVRDGAGGANGKDNKGALREAVVLSDIPVGKRGDISAPLSHPAANTTSPDVLRQMMRDNLFALRDPAVDSWLSHYRGAPMPAQWQGTPEEWARYEREQQDTPLNNALSYGQNALSGIGIGAGYVNPAGGKIFAAELAYAAGRGATTEGDIGDKAVAAGESLGVVERVIGSLMNERAYPPEMAHEVYQLYRQMSPEDRDATMAAAKDPKHPKHNDAKLMIEIHKAYKEALDHRTTQDSWSLPAFGKKWLAKLVSKSLGVGGGEAAGAFWGDNDDSTDERSMKTVFGGLGAQVAGEVVKGGTGGLVRAGRALLADKPLGESKRSVGALQTSSGGFGTIDVDKARVLALSAASNPHFHRNLERLYPSMTSAQRKEMVSAVDGAVRDLYKPVAEGLEEGAAGMARMPARGKSSVDSIAAGRKSLGELFTAMKEKVRANHYAFLDDNVLRRVQDGGKGYPIDDLRAAIGEELKAFQGHSIPALNKLFSLLSPKPVKVAGKDKPEMQINLKELDNARSEISALTANKINPNGIPKATAARIVKAIDGFFVKHLSPEDNTRLLTARDEWSKVQKLFDDKGDALGGMMSRARNAEDVIGKLVPGGDEKSAAAVAGRLKRLAAAFGGGDSVKGGEKLGEFLRDSLSDEQSLRLFSSLRTQQVYDNVLGEKGLDILAQRALGGYLGITKELTEGGFRQMFDRITPDRVKSIREHAIRRGADPGKVDKMMQSAYVYAKFENVRELQKRSKGKDIDPERLNEALAKDFNNLMGTDKKSRDIFDALFDANPGDAVSPRERIAFFAAAATGLDGMRKGESVADFLQDMAGKKHVDNIAHGIMGWVRTTWAAISPAFVVTSSVARIAKERFTKMKVQRVINDLTRIGLSGDPEISAQASKVVRLWQAGKKKEFQKAMTSLYRSQAEFQPDEREGDYKLETGK